MTCEDFQAFQADLAEEAAGIAEAIAKVAELRAQRDSAARGSRKRAVTQIILDWWEAELSAVTGGLSA